MATKLYTNDIGKHVDWGGDNVTGGYPVSGEKVQKFIKDTLAKKFGYLYFDKDNLPGHDATNQYIIFADEEDFIAWFENPNENKALELGSFNAPAPATIYTRVNGSMSNTILISEADNQEISIDYYILKSDKTYGSGEISYDISIRNGANVIKLPKIKPEDLVKYNLDKKDPFNKQDNSKDDPSRLVFGKNSDISSLTNLGQYLQKGNNIITIILTSELFNVSTTLTFQYNVIDFVLTSSFDYQKGIAIDDASIKSLLIPIHVEGQGQKYIRVFIDGQNVLGSENESKYVGGDLSIDFTYGSDATHGMRFEGATWAKEGKHTLQFYCFIQNGATEIKSKTLYYDFVLTKRGMINKTYILFKRENDSGELITETELSITSEQYNEMILSFIAYNTSDRLQGSDISLDFIITKEGETEPIATKGITVGNGTWDEEKNNFKYTFQDWGNMTLEIKPQNDDVSDSSFAHIDVRESSAKVSEATNGLLMKMSAMNRSNGESEDIRNDWHYDWYQVGQEEPTVFKATFNNVLFNKQSGWQDNCLVLNNASVSFNISPFQYFNPNNGLTIEIDFETANVQDDNAPIMRYGSESGAHIFINACNTEMKSNNGSTITTHYKDNSRQKIQFIYAGNVKNQQDITKSACVSSCDLPFLYYMVVNGILDRVVKFDDSISTADTSMTIGNLDGKVTVKLHSVKVYNRALTLDECVDNYILDSSDILTNYNKNNVYNEGSKELSINKILENNVPVMRIYGDVQQSIVKLFNKKSNVPVDVLYEDRNNPEMNFFATDCWMSNQGTSSMNYPRRNLRLYFNKVSDDNTVRGYGTNEQYQYCTRVFPGLIDQNAITEIQNDSTHSIFEINGIRALCNKKWKDSNFGTIKDSVNSTKGAQYELLKNLMCPVDEQKAKRMWHSNIKLYLEKSSVNETTGETIYEFKKVKNFNKDCYGDDKKFKADKVFVYGGYTHFKEKDLYTDRWTLKCDYAESSMTHNAGVGRLWGDVMANTEISTGGFRPQFDPESKTISDVATNFPCRTFTQEVTKAYTKKNGIEYGDIRTSCDGYPIVIINYPRKRNENGEVVLGQWESPIFLGLHNIMTDKGSTPLFGFEDLKDDDGSLLYDAGNRDETENAEEAYKEEIEKENKGIQLQRTECWECLQNGSALAQMYDMKTDVEYGDDSRVNNNEDRYVWRTYEARWPDNDNLDLTLTNRLESVIRFVNFCKDAVTVTVSGRDGYTMSDYSEIDYSNGVFNKLGISLQQLKDNPALLRSIIESENSSIIDNNSWDGKLYVEEYAKSPKDRTSKFYETNEDGSYATNADGSYKFLDATTPEGKSKILSQIKKIESSSKEVVHKISYSSGQSAAASSISAMQPIYNMDASDDEKVAAVAEVMNSDTPTLYEMVTDENDTSIVEIDPILIDVTNADYKFYYYDSAFDRSDIHKSISNKKITNEIYTGLVYTFDGKRKNLDGDSLHPEAWTRVYLEKATTGNRYNYIDECGNQALYNGEPEEEKCSGYYGTKGASFVGKTYMDYFKDKKYEHFDVWKLAAYYVYIMRFAAVDQIVKNTMMTTEDGQHYYFINYDNDTTMGVRNDGYLVFDWQIDRNSYDSTGNSYAYAGFGSVLWNLLEQDDDFMNKVKTVATAMVTSGVLTYDIALDMFNNKQCGTWSERLYNNSEMYKYIGIFKDIDNEGNPKKYDPFTNTRYLPFLQGSRKSHREWWLRHRFDLFDSKWGAGEYSTFYAQIYWNGVAASAQLPKPVIRLKSGSKFYYTFNSDNQNLDSQVVNGEPGHENEVLANVGFVELGAEESCLVKTKMSLAIGNPIKVLGVHKATEIDLSPAKEQLTSAIEFSPSLQSMELKVLNVGGENTNSCGIEGIINLHKCTALEKLNIRGCNNRNFTLLDISTLYNLNTYLAANTNLTTFEPAVNSIMDKVELGSMVKTLVLDKISFTQDDSFIYSPTKILTSATLNNCTINGKDLDIVKFLHDWNIAIDSDPDTKAQKRSYKCSLAFNEIEVTKEQLREISKMKQEFGLDINGNPNFVITSGIIKLKGQLDRELYDELTTGIQTAFYADGTTRVWGDSFFTSQSAARFDAEQESIFVEAEVNGVKVADITKISIVAGQEVSMKAIIFPMSSDRTIEFVPYYVNKQGNPVAWSKNTSGQYYRNYHGTITQTRYNSYLTNEYGFATLSTHEYDVFDTVNNAVNNGDFVDIRIPLMVKDENSDNTEQKSLLKVTMERTKKPAAVDIEMYKGNNSNPIEMDVVNDATLPIEYIIKYRSYDAFNIDILSVESYMTATECGSLTSEIKLDDDNNQYISVIYAPKIKQVDTDFAIVVDVTLNDADNTVLNKQLNISLKTKAISSNSLVMKYGDDVLESYLDTEGVKTFKFVKYFKNITKTKTREDLPITLELTDYNVNIKKMTLGTTILEDADIAKTEDKNTNRIETITFTINNLSKSLINSGILNIQLTDEFDQQINWRLDFYIATFYADGVDIIKYEKRNDLYQLDTLDIDLLLDETNTQFIYKANVYSLIGSVKYYFISETDTSEFISNFENTITLDKTVFGTEETFVSALKYNIGVHSDPTNTTTFEPIALLEAVTSTNPFMKVFNIKSGTETGIIKDCHISVNISNKEYITDNKVKFFTVSKDGCSAKDGNWNNLASGFYIVDMNKRFYYMDVNTGNNNAWSTANIIHKDIDGVLKPFCVTYIYEDINSIKRSISLDPKLLLENKHYYWWKENSTYVQNTNIIPLLDNQRPALFSKLNGTTYNSLGELFEQYVKYYALVCYNSNNPEDKVRLILNTNPSTVTTESLAQDIHDRTIKIDDITFLDSDMIFSKCYYYKKTTNMPYVCRPLSVEEIQMLLLDANRRTELEFALDYVGISLEEQISESDENWISKIMDESIYTVTVGDGTKYLTTTTEPNRETGEVNATIDLRCIWTFNFLNTVASNQWQMDGFKEFKRCPYIAQLNYNTSTNECNIPYSGINQLAGRCYWSYGKISVIWGPDLSYSL